MKQAETPARPSWIGDLDRQLLAAPRWVIVSVIVATWLAVIAQGVPNVPREYVDLSPVLGNVQRYETYGSDTVADVYAARVISADVSDMYTKDDTPQTPVEAATWSPEASAPYPPLVLLVETALYQLGTRTGVGFYGTILLIAALFLAGSCVYFLRTRWYLFPLLYLNFEYLGFRFVYVQDNSYLVMLLTLLAALFLARAGRPISHALVATAAAMKLSPLFYLVNVRQMTLTWRVVCAAILIVGLVLPYWIWEDYLYIYSYGNALKGDWASSAGALIMAAPFALAVWYVQERRGFDIEDRIGWAAVPVALFLAWKMNVARHLLLVLLLPDKRGARNVAAAAGLLVPAALPDLVAFNSSLTVASAVLVAALGAHLRAVGGAQIRADLTALRHALRRR